MSLSTHQPVLNKSGKFNFAHAMLLATTSLGADFVAGESRPAGLEEVIVTSRRTEEALQDVPLSITAMNAEALKNSNVQIFADLQQKVPSLAFSPSTGRRTTQTFAIRGQRSPDPAITNDPTVGIYIADVPVVRTQGVAVSGFLDVSSIEVLKGPQGTLFGRNTTGGAVVITPNEPNDNFEGYVSGGIGAYNRRKAEFVANAPLTDDTAIRLAGTRATRDGVINNRAGFNDPYNDDYYAGRTSLRSNLTDKLTTKFYGDYFTANDDGGASVITAVNPAIVNSQTNQLLAALAKQKNSDFYSVETDKPAYNNMKVGGISNTTTYDINDELTLKNILGYRQLESEDFTDLDGTPIPATTVRRVANVNQISEEIQLQGDSGDLNWVTGLFFFRERGDDNSYSWSRRPATPPDGGDSSGGKAENKSYSAFAQGTYALTDALNLTVGARITRDERSYKSLSFRYTNPAAPTCLVFADNVTNTLANPCQLSDEKTFSSPTWNISLDYKLDATQLVYAATRRGYRTGGFSSRATRPAQLEPFDPETVTDLEIGYKGDLDVASRPLRINVATFYSDYQDIQRSVTYFDSTTQRPFNLIKNAASGTVWGGELEATWLPIDNLEVSLFYARIHAGFDKAEADNSTGTGKVDLSYNKFGTTPEHKGGVTLRYRLPYNGDAGEFFVQGGGTWQSEMWLDVGNRFDGTNTPIPGTRQSGYALYDARIDWQNVMGQPLSISAWGRNLSNTEYFNSATQQYTSSGYVLAFPGEPRTWGIDVKYDF